jgi:cytochrome c2
MRKIVVVVVLASLAGGGIAWAGDPPAIYDKKCKVCHSIGGVGGPMAKSGGPLDDVGSKRDEAWLRAYLADPKSKIENSKMPKTNLAGPDLDAVVGFMLSLKKPAETK